MKSDVWKQDIGQWVERKGRRDWAKQPKPQSATPRAAARVGFLPSGFQDQQRTPVAAGAANVATVMPPLFFHDTKSAAAPGEGLRWVTVHGVSTGSVLDLREYLDVVFGRTVSHCFPPDVQQPWLPGECAAVGSGLQTLHVQFDDPVAAARAVFKSPMTIPSADATRPEEVVAVSWCTEETVIDSASTRPPSSERENEKDGDARNAAGAIPCEAERLPPRSESAGGRSSSRGLGSALWDILASPLSARWTAAPPTSPPETQPVPICLVSGRHGQRDAAQRLKQALPVWPLKGNTSVLSAFSADARERALPRRAFRALTALPTRVVRFLFAPSNAPQQIFGGERGGRVFAAATPSEVSREPAIARWYEQQERLLRQRHYGAVSRLHGADANSGDTALVSWAPCRWYERYGLYSVMLLLLLLGLMLFFLLEIQSRTELSEIELLPFENTQTVESKTVTTQSGAYTGVLSEGQLQGVLIADNTYGGNRYFAQTL